MPRNVEFSSLALNQLMDWQRQDARAAAKLLELIAECTRTPFEGRGKPEALKGNYRGYWSRRITQEHRLIYRVTDDVIFVYSCWGHYT